MSDELSIFGDPKISFSVSSPVEVVTALITSVASVKNVEKLTKAKHAEIQGALKACDMVLKSHERDFATKMLQQKENLDILYNFLEMMLDGVKNSQGDNAAYCRDISIALMHEIGEISKNGPPIVNLTWNL